MTGASIRPLFSGTIMSCGSAAEPIFGGTTEIQKEIIARSLGL